MELLRYTFLDPADEGSDVFGELCMQSLMQYPELQRAIRWDHVAGPNHTAWVCEGILPVFKLAVHRTALYNYAARVTASYILNHLESKLIQLLIKAEYGYHNADEMMQVWEYCRDVLNGTAAEDWEEVERTSRIDKLAEDIRQYIQEHTEVNIEGLVRFRLQSYAHELREVIEYSIDEYVMDQQYMEFISLLKYFVYVQEPKVKVVHLIHRNHEFYLFDEQMSPLQNQHIDPFVSDLIDHDGNTEDMVVSSLISTAPEKIVIHSDEPEVQIIHTLRQIFEGRYVLCQRCVVCELSQEGKKGPLKNTLYT